MPSTFLNLHCHIVFSTIHRELRIDASWQSRLHAYLGGIVHRLAAVPESIGGVADHVHLLVSLRATHCLSDFMRELKKASSAWVHDVIGLSAFAWQEGYAAFTVSPTACTAVRRYIENQADHHRTRSFREELIELLNRASIAFEEKYLD